MLRADWRWVLTLVLACRRVHSKTLHSFAGPFIAFAHRFDVCPSDGTLVSNYRNSHFNPAKPFERQTFWGNVSFKEALDDLLKGGVTMASRSNNQWKENAFVFNFPHGACSAIRDHVPDLFRILMKSASLRNDKKAPCRLPSGEFTIEKQPIRWEFPKFKIMPYGRYRFTVKGKRFNTTKYCLAVDSEVIPRPE